MLQCKVKFWSH